MVARPAFVQTNEAWVVWVLGEELFGSAPPAGIAARTGMSPAEVTTALTSLARIAAVRFEGAPDPRHGYPCAVVQIGDEGKRMVEYFRRIRDIF